VGLVKTNWAGFLSRLKVFIYDVTVDAFLQFFGDDRSLQLLCWLYACLCGAGHHTRGNTYFLSPPATAVLDAECVGSATAMVVDRVAAEEDTSGLLLKRTKI
jgi:hypothetical protein